MRYSGRHLRGILLTLIVVNIALALGCATYPVRWERSSLKGAGIKGGIETRGGVLLALRSESGRNGGRAVCLKSYNGGRFWGWKSVVAEDKTPFVDIGDSSIIELKNGKILCAYRDNNLRNKSYKDNTSSIRVAESDDGGETWRHHSTVAECRETTCGVWASFLFEKGDGTLQCYFDDEYTPLKSGFPGHQWVTMKTWDEGRGAWRNPVTVSRAHNPEHLSRDGMPSVVELPGGRLLCALESVKTEYPFKGIIRSVYSDDGGMTWSWKEKERGVIYETRDQLYNSLAPWMIRTSRGYLVCVFITDEDRREPDTPSTSILREDVKAVYSFDDGETWSKKPQVISKKYPCVLPGIYEVGSPVRAGAGEQPRLVIEGKSGGYKGVDSADNYILLQFDEHGKIVTKRGWFKD